MKILYTTSALALSLVVAASLQAQAVQNDTTTTTTTETTTKPVPVVTTTGTTPAPDDDIVKLSLFEVSTSRNQGYYAPTSLAGSRLNTNLDDVGSAISVVTPEFLKDVGATNNQTLLAYTTNTEVGGAYGNYAGASGGQTQDESGNFTNPSGNNRIRGLTNADNARNFFTSEIPWDGYNVDRVDITRGSSSILFGLGSPAGIINNTTKSAEHRSFGSAQVRIGSYGSLRGALDWNQNLLPGELSFRIDVMGDGEKYRQKPAFSHDIREFGTVTYDPKFLAKNGAKTSLKINFEHGKITSDNPRTITPTDQITPWWDALNKQLYNPNTVQNSGYWLDGTGTPYFPDNMGQFNQNRTNQNGSSTPNPLYQPWIDNPGSMYGGIWLQYAPGQTNTAAATQPEYRNVYGINAAGTVQNLPNGIAGLPYSRRVTPSQTYMWASRAATPPAAGQTYTQAPYASWGLWKNKTLSDPSIFDFYNTLIDGDNKNEWQDFNNFSASLTQSFFKEKLGIKAAYNHEDVDRGQYSYNGPGTLYMDINSANLDGSANPYAGTPYVQSNYLYGNNSYSSKRDAWQLNAYFDQKFYDAGHRSWFWKLLGRQTINGLLSGDVWKNDSRNFARYLTSDDFAAYDGGYTGGNSRSIMSNDRQVNSTIYMGGSLINAPSYVNAHIPGPSEASIPGSVPFTYFDSHWKATGVNPADPWTNYNGTVSTQSQNPANYVGWTTSPVTILSAAGNDQDPLTWQAVKNKRDLSSIAGTWQGYFWDGAVVGLYGIRHDKVKTSALQGTTSTVTNRVDFSTYDFSNPSTINGEFSKTTTSESIVVKLNKFLPENWDRKIPLNISVYAAKSDNFQVTGPRSDVFGHALPPPTGDTHEYGIMLSTKDQRYVLKINNYETKVKNANNSTGFTTWYLFGQDNFLMRMSQRADTYQYHLAVPGNLASADTTTGLTGSGGWVWRYYPTPGQTQAQADALAASAAASWRSYAQQPIVQQILQAWGFSDVNTVQLPYMTHPVANYQATEDQLSKGWEFEFTANPLKNWRFTLNAAEVKAMHSNIGGSELQQFIALTNTYMNDPNGMGQIRTWGGDNSASTALLSWNSNFYASYLLMKLQEGTYTNDIRKWRVNAVTSYDFDTGPLKGLTVGLGYRWQDKVAIGYPVKQVSSTQITFDLDNPYYGPTNTGVDFWIGYTFNMTRKIKWNIQLNIRDLGAGKKLIPLTTEYDGTVAAWGIAPSQTWTLTNTFSF